MDRETLSRCFAYDARTELQRMIEIFTAGADFVFPAGMEDHFRLAKEKPAGFRDHPPTLGISLGGTNSKAMIASMQSGRLVVHHVVATKNPKEPTSYQDYLDGLLIQDRVVKAYLENTPERGLGFSFPMSVIDGAPFHATKVPTVEGLIARSRAQDLGAFRFSDNLARYLESRGLPPVPTFYQGDGIVAHHGAVSLYDLPPRDKSVLLVCGTGLATGDERAYVQIGIAPLLENDDQLYPMDQTEDRQLQYAVAGKGLFGLMARAIKLRAQDPASPLAGLGLERHFVGADDSRTVEDVWQASFGEPEVLRRVRRQLDADDPDVMAELGWISERIMERVIASLANCVLATIVSMGPADSGKGHVVFFEGSVATSPNVLPRMKSEIQSRAAETRLYTEVDVPPVLTPRLASKLRPLKAADGITGGTLDDVDITLIGAVTSMMAETCRRSL